MFAASDDPVMTLDRLNAALGALHVEMLEVVWTVGVSGAWRGDGASDLPHWLAMRYGISWWKGRRIVTASRALRRLPIITEALRDGRLSLDKVLELARFATAEEEHRQLKWAQGVSVRAVRQKADLYEARSKRELLGAERSRSLGWYWTDEGTRLMLAGEFPAAQGAAVVKAIERMASKMPAMPDEEGSHGIGARRADALAAICSSNLASDRDVDRAMLIVHASEETVSALAGRELAAPGKAARREATRKVAAAAFQDGPAIHPDVLSRLLCTSKIQVVGEDANGNVMALGRDSREPSPAMMRQLRYRDGGCRFPGCGSGRFLNAHHIQHWARGGKTDLDNLVSSARSITGWRMSTAGRWN
jgi:hypothetical protein